MDKDCCNVKTTEIEDAFTTRITGDKVKECCEVAMKEKSGCCSGDDKKGSKVESS